MKTIGGFSFIRNAFEYDYCLDASINSLLDLCDEVIMVDCESTDGTLEYLYKKASVNNKLKIHHHKWECASGYKRFRILTEYAKNQLETDWSFLLYADEVLHHESIPVIRQAMEIDADTILCRRLNFWNDFNTVFKTDSLKCPTKSYLPRLGRPLIGLYADGDYFCHHRMSAEVKDSILIFHYSWVRDKNKNVTRIENTLDFYFNKKDPRIETMKKRDGVFNPAIYNFEDSNFEPLWLSHPKYALTWIDETEKKNIKFL